ncbi:glycosyltransferase family 2 protein, partial [Candidatus Bathyarchaeota archaeon]
MASDSRRNTGYTDNSRQVVFVGIPAFNVERSIAMVVVQAKTHCDQIVVCDDGSTDQTRQIAESLGCKVVRHEKNQGYGAAIRTLMDTARGGGADILVTVDGDGQHNPKEIEALIDPIRRGEADMVIGTRLALRDADANIPRFRSMGIKAITKIVAGLSQQKVTDAQSGFRAYGRRALDSIHPGERGMGASTEILLEAKANNLRIVEVPSEIKYSKETRSTLNPAYHFTDVVGSTIKVASLRHPLLVFGLPGAIFLITSLVFGIWALDIFAKEGRLVTNLTLISVGGAIIGTILV